MIKSRAKEATKAVAKALRQCYEIGDYATKALLAEGVADILTDIRHFCDTHGIAFAEADRDAQCHYTAEVVGARHDLVAAKPAAAAKKTKKACGPQQG